MGIYKCIYLYLKYGEPVVHFVYNIKPLFVAIIDLFVLCTQNAHWTALFLIHKHNLVFSNSNNIFLFKCCLKYCADLLESS